MFSTFRTTAIGAGALALAQFASPAQAAFIFTMEQVGTSVVVNGSGSINTTGLTLQSITEPPGLVADGFLVGGPSGTNPVEDFMFATGPNNFGSGTVFFGPTTTSGDAAGVISAKGLIAVPSGYVSGHSLSNTMTFANETFSGLGVTPGTYKWTWGSGANADSFTLDIVAPTAAPEPASLALLAVGLAGLGMALRMRRA